MEKKDELDKLFGQTDPLDDQLAMNDKKDHLDEVQDNDEEIIELTDPDDTPVAESDEEIIEPADFLDDLSVDDTTFVFQAESDDADDDIIELTETASEPPEHTVNSKEGLSAGRDLTSNGKDLFIFTDTKDEAYIDDDDILSDTVFSGSTSKPDDLRMNKDLDILTQKKKDLSREDSSMFDATVFAKELSENDDEFSVLAQINDKLHPIEKDMFNDTVFSNESLNNDDELAVLTEPKDNKIITDRSAAFTDASALDSNLVLIEDTQIEPPPKEESFIQSDIARSTEKVSLEIESATDRDIADSLGMDLESEKDLFMNIETEDDNKLTIVSESEYDTRRERFENGRELNKAQLHPLQQSIQSDQLEAALEKVIKRIFTGKIDTMIADIIEKAVKTDIEKIKKELLKGTADDV